jgi:hypothetical protein
MIPTIATATLMADMPMAITASTENQRAYPRFGLLSPYPFEVSTASTSIETIELGQL